MPYEIEKTFVISQKMIDQAKADGTLYVNETHNLLIDRIKNALGSIYRTNTAVTIRVRTHEYGSHGYPLSPEPENEGDYYLPSAVVNQLEAWRYQKARAVRDHVPFEPTCETMRFTLRLKAIPARKA